MKKGSFLLIKNNSFHSISNLNYDEIKGFRFKPLNNVEYDGVTVKKMLMVNPSFVEKVLKRKIKKRLEIYLRFIISIIDEDDSTTDVTNLRAALNDFTRFREIVKHKYMLYLDKQYTKLLLDKMDILEQELKNKIVSCKMFEEKNLEEEYHRRR